MCRCGGVILRDLVKLPNGKFLVKKSRVVENSSTRLKSALFNRGKKIRTFAILTAENPLGERKTAEENNKLMDKLKEELRALHLNYIKVNGMYGNREHSVMIVNLSYDDAENLAGTFIQDSFIFGDETGIKYYKIDRSLYEKTGEIKYDLMETSNRVDTLKDADDYFSQHGDFKFSIYYDLFNEKLEEPLNIEYFEESIQEGRTSRYRTENRILAYKKEI